MGKVTWRRAALAWTALALCACAKQPSDVERGRHLVQIIACGDCHSPGGFTPHPDTNRLLSGSDAEFDVPGEGVYVPPNLTPDPETGIGKWTQEQTVTAITTGVTPDWRILSSAMPWADFKQLSHEDAMAIAAYLKSLPPIVNRVPGPAAEKPLPPHTVETILFR
jgi:mono/diheme cytochrome c family protein